MNSTFSYGPDVCDFTINPPVLPDAEGIYPVPVPGMTKLKKGSSWRSVVEATTLLDWLQDT